MRSADHITDALASLHWLRVPERIEYKVAVLTQFLTEVRRGTWGLLFLLPICAADGHYVLLAPIVCWCHLLDFRQSVTGLSRLLDPMSGTLCRRT